MKRHQSRHRPHNRDLTGVNRRKERRMVRRKLAQAVAVFRPRAIWMTN